jgi:hypothetical protein
MKRPLKSLALWKSEFFWVGSGTFYKSGRIRIQISEKWYSDADKKNSFGSTTLAVWMLHRLAMRTVSSKPISLDIAVPILGRLKTIKILNSDLNDKTVTLKGRPHKIFLPPVFFVQSIPLWFLIITIPNLVSIMQTEVNSHYCVALWIYRLSWAGQSLKRFNDFQWSVGKMEIMHNAWKWKWIVSKETVIK